MKMEALLCPVCNGRGTVPAGFYDPGLGCTNTSAEKCRSCQGQGYILVYDYGCRVTYHYPEQPDYWPETIWSEWPETIWPGNDWREGSTADYIYKNGFNTPWSYTEEVVGDNVS
jgi:hypothetical protein